MLNRFLSAGGLRGCDVFGEPIEADTYQPAPCISIPITDEMRLQDEADRQRRELAVGTGWEAKSSLSVDNLRTIRKPASTGRIESRREVILPSDKASRRKDKESKRKARKLNAVLPKPVEENKMKAAYTFATLEPVPIAGIPAGRVGTTSPYTSIYDKLTALPAGQALPVTVDGPKGATAITSSLKRLAVLSKKLCVASSSPNGKTLYFYLLDKPKDQPAA